ncbi:MAG: energy transducer TonB [Curvibacter sp.]
MKSSPVHPAPAGRRQALALLLSVSLHVLALALVLGPARRADRAWEPAPPADEVLVLEVAPLPVTRPDPQPVAPAPLAPTDPGVQASPVVPAAPVATPPVPPQPAFMEAPPAPTAQEWALAAGYTLKNSKRYRYTWGQQVRSMMGTAIQGPDQGVVRFRVEIAPDGSLARLDTLWSTSDVAERLARQAVQNMPPLPPTPTGRPLVFEQTISFQPFETGGPPVYRDDCLPDPPAFRNPFAWDGQAPTVRAAPAAQEAPDPEALEACLKSLPPDTVEAESAQDRRQLERWGTSPPRR